MSSLRRLTVSSSGRRNLGRAQDERRGRLVPYRSRSRGRGRRGPGGRGPAAITISGTKPESADVIVRRPPGRGRHVGRRAVACRRKRNSEYDEDHADSSVLHGEPPQESERVVSAALRCADAKNTRPTPDPPPSGSYPSWAELIRAIHDVSAASAVLADPYMDTRPGSGPSPNLLRAITYRPPSRSSP